MAFKRFCFFLIMGIATHVYAASSLPGNSADFIVVGVGTAGSLMVKTLTDDKTTSVIALHNGENLNNQAIIKYSKNTALTVPSILLQTVITNLPNIPLPPDEKSVLDELFKESLHDLSLLYESGQTTTQPFADDRQIVWGIATPQGGASSINAGAWCRGTNEVYAQWQAVAGPVWSVDRIQNIYKELEHYKGKTPNSKARGYHGPVRVSQVSRPSEVAQKFSQAVIDATGFPFVLDYNNPKTPIGVSPQFQYTQRGKKQRLRVSGSYAFLNSDAVDRHGHGVDGRKLKILYDSTALRVIWNDKTAVGVEYSQNGVTKQVFANKGVIVCAGLRSSPFLMYSGIGPAALLNSLGIPVKFNNPNVGQNLIDQAQVPVVFTANPEDSATIRNTNEIFSQISWLPAPGRDPNSRQVRLATIDAVPGILVALIDLCQPKSRGSVTINSANPLSPPVINLGVLSNSSDLDLYTAFFQTYLKAINQKLQATYPDYGLVFPPPAILDDVTLIQEYVKTTVGCNQCFQSHCRMAPLNQGGVVDSTGAVYGVKNLYIADNSIVPVAMDGTPMASGYMIAANIAKLLGY